MVAREQIFFYAVALPEKKQKIWKVSSPRGGSSPPGKKNKKIGKLVHPGANLGFSREGGLDFQKIFENFVDLFFR